MPQANFIELVLTCENRAEAEKIAHALLKKHLIACAKYLPIESSFWWKGEIIQGKEVMLLMQSVAEHFEKVEAEVAKLHSYETFVLQAFPITKISRNAATWLAETATTD